MKKILTLLLALITFTISAFTQCAPTAFVNSPESRLFLDFVDASAATAFLAASGGTVTITPPGVTLALEATSSSARLRIPISGTGLTAGNYTGTIEITGQVCTYVAGVLPVSLSSFTGKKMEKSILLQWKTASELNNDHFAIERSTDGRNFEQLTKVTGEGTTAETVAYSFEDKQPEFATNYYRLRQVDFDGHESLSDIIAVNFTDTRLALKLYPTQVRGEVNLDLTSYGNKDAEINILNTSGKIVLSKVVNSRDIITLNLGELNLSEGVYYAHCRLSNQVLVKKFLVVR